MTKQPEVNVNADGEALRDRFIQAFNAVKPEEWQSVYRLLEEWQLLGVALLIFEGLEEK